ncbi:MAG TPA: hypothetical protein VHD83_04225 [Puia sp.]|nr:hypothetical protein [Puia sp.]
MGIKFVVVGVLAWVVGVQTLLPGEPVARPEQPGEAGLPARLSEYHIFEGSPSDLKPAAGFTMYDLATTLFTDYAEKQRLIKLPPGSQLRKTGDGLPVFPDGTMLVKTFYYYHDKQDTARGKRLIETRVMALSDGQWIWGTYLWNADGTEAMLTNASSRVRIEWRDALGANRAVRYVVPSHGDCAKCHNTAGRFMPLGPMVRNLRLGPVFTSSLPDWRDSSYSLQQRVGSYLDVNCAHCHNPDGFCARSGLDLRWGAALTDGRALRKMVKFMKKGRMPLIGATIVHQEGVALMEAYLKNLSNK